MALTKSWRSKILPRFSARNEGKTKIFDFCQIDYRRQLPVYPFRSIWEWRRLVHIVFGSSCHLDLQVLCTNGTRVRENLDIWPPFPIAIKYYYKTLTPYHEDSLFAALEHPGRICYVDLYLTGPQLREVATVIDLVSLYLDEILPEDYIVILPDATVTRLAAFPRLKFLSIRSKWVMPHSDQIRPPSVTRTLLPALTSIVFEGACKYLEDLVAQIDSPQLNQIDITCWNEFLDFRVGQLFKFIDRSQDSEMALIRHADAPTPATNLLPRVRTLCPAISNPSQPSTKHHQGEQMLGVRNMGSEGVFQKAKGKGRGRSWIICWGKKGKERNALSQDDGKGQSVGHEVRKGGRKATLE
ncbi:hypothetical protein BJY52DRAFT_1228695 [Lactarius psammicola]|nr:hypothetical protein BJY52DRAFT_1228695 [Lactarius psammicola]